MSDGNTMPFLAHLAALRTHLMRASAYILAGGAIAFGAMDGPLGAAIEGHGGKRFHLAGRLEINVWQGRQSVQLRLEDAAAA